ncbi:MAG: terminase TerL endonuclease subunit [Thermoguttaceae bacterium]|jgi:phage terminase large subunit-like protein
MPTATRKRAAAKKPETIEARVRAYIAGVSSGEIVACKWVKLAVARHVRDLKHSAKRGLHFDADAARLAVQFVECLPHSKGKWAGKPLRLEGWQIFIVWCVYGWMRSDGRRRFNTVLIVVARKNGKSTLCAGLALKALVCDGEAGAEVYSAATKRDQAKIVWSEARKMVLKSPSLKKIIGVSRGALAVESTQSTYQPLGRDADTLDGLNPSCAVIDEVHAHKDRAVWDVIESGTGARENPLLIGITTAGDGSPESIYAELKKRTEDVLTGAVEDDTWFGMIFTLDEGDSWQDERVWLKANPNLGVSVNIEDLRRLCQKAKESPASVANFRRKRCNEDVATSSPWLSVEEGSAWQACAGGDFYDGHGLRPETIERFRGRKCWVGADLSSLSDLTAMAFCFPCEDGSADLLAFAWCPRQNAVGRTRDNRVPYITWADMGLLKLTDGDSVNYDELRDTLRTARDAWGWEIQRIAFDPNNARYLLTKLAEEDGFSAEQLVEHDQRCGAMNEPILATEKLILDRKLRHGGHRALRWCVANAVIYTDTGGRRRFNKRRSREKIDLAVAAVMAVGCAASGAGAEPAGASIYDNLDHIIMV